MFKIGETVVYKHNVCEIANVLPAYVDGNDYFELHALFNTTLKLYVPIEGAKERGLRYPLTKSEAIALIEAMPAIAPIDEAALAASAGTPTLLERRIKEEYDARLKSMSPYDLPVIMKTVHERTTKRENAGRSITTTDKNYFDKAEKLLFDELSVALNIPRESVKDFVIERAEKASAKVTWLK